MTGAPAAGGSRGAAASVPAVAGGFGGNVFPAESAGMMAGAPAAAESRGEAPVVASGSGGNAFPAESAGMMAGTPAAAGSSGAAFQAASSAVRPPPANVSLTTTRTVKYVAPRLQCAGKRTR